MLLLLVMLQLNAMQQYCIAPTGYPPLHAWATAHTAAMHAPLAPTATCITTGSNATLEVKYVQKHW